MNIRAIRIGMQIFKVPLLSAYKVRIEQLMVYQTKVFQKRFIGSANRFQSLKLIRTIGADQKYFFYICRWP